jgi:hypothetical protein
LKFPKRFKEIGVISIVLIVSLSYGLYFYLQGLTEDSINTNLFEQQRLGQLDTNNAISQHISSDLDSIVSRLKVIANSVYAQQGNLSGDGIELILQEMYNDTTHLVGKADNLFIAERNDIITHIASDQEEQRSLFDVFVGNNISFREYAYQTKATLKPVFSTGLLSSDGVYRIIITYPIINRVRDL